MAELVKLHGDDKFKVIGINTDTDPDEYKTKAEDAGVTWRNTLGSGGHALAAVFGVQAFPTVILIDKNGVARWQDNFFEGDADFKRILAELIAETK